VAAALAEAGKFEYKVFEIQKLSQFILGQFFYLVRDHAHFDYVFENQSLKIIVTENDD
jgi:hypothetical protein